jgi:hypothetical protein
MARSSAAKAGRGRPRGSANKITNEAKRAMLMAFDKLGGVDRLVAWVKEDKANEFAYYTKMFPKLLPRPAVDVVPAPEPPAPVKGAYTWKTPDWAKKVEKAQLRYGIARVAAALEEPEVGRDRAPPSDPEDD